MGRYELKQEYSNHLITTYNITFAFISGKLNDQIPVAVKIIWGKQFSVREKNILEVLDATNSEIEEKGIPRIYYTGPLLQYDAIVMTLFEGDLESRFRKQKKINDLSILMIFKRSVS